LPIVMDVVEIKSIRSIIFGPNGKEKKTEGRGTCAYRSLPTPVGEDSRVAAKKRSGRTGKKVVPRKRRRAKEKIRGKVVLGNEEGQECRGWIYKSGQNAVNE